MGVRSQWFAWLAMGLAGCATPAPATTQSSEASTAASTCCSSLDRCVEEATRLNEPSALGMSADRKCVADALTSFGTPAISSLEPLLFHPSGRARDIAAVALGGMGSAAKPAVPSLIRSHERYEQGWQGWALHVIGDPAAIWVFVRRCETEWVSEFGATAAEALVAQLTDPLSSVDECYCAAGGMILVESMPDTFLPKVRASLELVWRLERAGVRDHGRKMHPPFEQRQGEGARLTALVMALGAFEIGPVKGILREIGAAGPPDARRAAQALLRSIEPSKMEAEAIKDLENPDFTVRLNTLMRPKEVGAEAPAAVPALSRIAQDGTSYERARAVRALGNSGSPRAIPALMKALSVRNYTVNAEAAAAMGSFGVWASVAVDRLRSVARDHWYGLARQNARDALTMLGIDVASIPVRNDPPPAAYQRGASYLVSTGGRTIAIHPLEPNRGARLLDSGCVAPEDEHWTVSKRVGALCVFGSDKGEWGGSVLLSRADATQPHLEWKSDSGVKVLEESRGEVIALASTSHMDSYHARAVRLTLEPKPHVEELVELPGAILGVVQHQGGLVMAVESSPSEGVYEVRAVIMSPEGELTLLPIEIAPGDR